MNYPLLQIPRERPELRCAIAAKRRPRNLDTAEDAVARVLECFDVYFHRDAR